MLLSEAAATLNRGSPEVDDEQTRLAAVASENNQRGLQNLHYN
jgi:hypothetical protein